MMVKKFKIYCWYENLLKYFSDDEDDEEAELDLLGALAGNILKIKGIKKIKIIY